MNALVSEPWIRLACFAAMFSLMAWVQRVRPLCAEQTSTPQRWWNHFSLAGLNTLAVRMFFPTGLAGIAILASERGWGLFNNVSVPDWFAFIATLVLLDFVIYLQHVMFHAVPILWRVHRVHHADREFDVTTGIRFHVIEILLSFGIKLLAVILIGASPIAILCFEVLLNATSLFNHANIRLPCWLDQTLRWVLVTPEMHRIHHSADPIEANRNFGFTLTWWDMLLGTYLRQAARDLDRMTIGLENERDPKTVDRLTAILAMPFREAPGQALKNVETRFTNSRPVAK